MATYAIGDVQGCFDELQALLARVGFNREHDRLWFVGDLVNRGPKSLEVLRFVMELGDRAAVVLGNHDLHLVTQYEGFERKRKDDTFSDVLVAPDAKNLVDWVRTRPMLHVEGGWAMVHAGLLPSWSIDKAASLASEVEQALCAPDYRDFLANMYGSKPERWDDSLAGWDRLRVIVNALTRMRYCKPDGTMECHTTGIQPPTGFDAWYHARQSPDSIVFGHWSHLGLKLTERVAGLDTGCVWGGPLSALRLEDRWLAQVPSPGYQRAGGKE
ncbi:MAG: symmetrical bis(5'-nucleosyl)-tetraphosphatase [Betaproteobacteria bacterium]|nr:symmetrical bis(5'-nucleosyl)-tetraphosphatase [Betaproteobacteria bacterium]